MELTEDRIREIIKEEIAKYDQEKNDEHLPFPTYKFRTSDIWRRRFEKSRCDNCIYIRAMRNSLI